MDMIGDINLTSGSADYQELIRLLEGKGLDNILNPIVSGTTTFETTECVDLLELLKFPQERERSRIALRRPLPGSYELIFIVELNNCLQHGVVNGIASGTKFGDVIPKCLGRVGNNMSRILTNTYRSLMLPIVSDAKYTPRTDGTYTNLDMWKIALVLLRSKHHMLNPPTDQ